MVTEAQRSVDLSPFDPSVEQISQLLLNNRMKSGISTLSLSGNQHNDSELLQQVIHNLPNVKALYLFNTPQRALQTKLDIIRDTKILLLYDTELFAIPLIEHSSHNTLSPQPRPVPAVRSLDPVVTRQLYIRFPALKLAARTIAFLLVRSIWSY